MNALDAAVAVAREHGVRVDEPRVLKDAHNLVVHLAPSPVVARVGRKMTELRPHIKQRELELTLWLVERGLAVLPVADELPPRVYVHDGQQMTFWRHAGEERERDGAAAGHALRAIDEALRDYDGELDGFWPVDETRTVLHALELPRFVSDVLEEVAEQLQYEPTALHGDAHLGNCFFTGDGPLWGDLEDACLAPPEWDAACLVLPLRLDGPDAEYEATLAELSIEDQERLELLVLLRAVLTISWGTFVHGWTERIEQRLEWLRANVP